METNFLTNTKIKVTPEESKRVQELAFKLGYSWGINKLVKLENTNEPYLYFNNNSITYGTITGLFTKKDYTEITMQEVDTYIAEQKVVEYAKSVEWNDEEIISELSCKGTSISEKD